MYQTVQWTKTIFRERNTIFLFYKILTSDPSIYIRDHPKFIVSNQKEGHKGLKVFITSESLHYLHKETMEVEEGSDEKLELRITRKVGL